ncbi:hypothetical protein THIX_90541 [Thiomonas sp. X19]|nr:hypothetical protein THIX_90541 [Thiomonas sp. X19]
MALRYAVTALRAARCEGCDCSPYPALIQMPRIPTTRPMPLADLLHARLLTNLAKGRNHLAGVATACFAVGCMAASRRSASRSLI